MTQFKVGHRVRATGTTLTNVPKDTLGTVMEVSGRGRFPLTVNFDVAGGDDWPVELSEVARVVSLAPQTAKVLSLLRAKGSLTAVEAQAVAKVRSLTRRITDLREAGFSVLSETRRDTEGQRYVRYYLNEQAA